MIDIISGNGTGCIRNRPSSGSPSDPTGELLERIYQRYHHSRFIHPDPLEIVRRYQRPHDREVVALIVSSLSLGRVNGILGACESALVSLGPHPAETLVTLRADEIRAGCRGFVYRFFTADHLSRLLLLLGGVIRHHGSLEALFLEGFEQEHESTVPALERFASALRATADGPTGILLPLSGRGGTMKRLHLFLRWMVRSDGIDPGGWSQVRPAQLVAPIDTHMHRIARTLGFTSRRGCDARTAIEVTRALRGFDPDDPVRFDFSLTRLGIHPDLGYDELVAVAPGAPDLR